MSKIYLLVLIAIASFNSVYAINQKMSSAPISLATTQQQQKLLSQADISKVDIQLSEVCTSQREKEAIEMLNFGHHDGFKGKKYNYKMVPPKLGEFRVAFVGDSITMGCCGNIIEEMLATPEQERITDNKLGYFNGMTKNYPSLLRQLLEKNNKTMDYAFLNYAIGGGQINNEFDKARPYLTNCRFEQLMKSLPHVVYIAFGYMDTMDPKYNEQDFINKYVQFIQAVQNLPSKPIVMLQTVMSNNMTWDNGKHCITNKNDPYFPAYHPDCKRDTMLDLQPAFYKIAEKTGIPEHHVVNAWHLLRLNPDVAAKDNFIADGVHPNLRGMGTIAQDIFMKMSLSPEILERQQKQKKGLDEDWNNAVMAQLLLQKTQQVAQFPKDPTTPMKQEETPKK